MTCRGEPAGGGEGKGDRFILFNLNYALPILFAILVVFGLILLTAEVRWLLHLKSKHHDVWVSIGGPSILPFRPISEQRRLREFVTSGTYRNLADLRLDVLTRQVEVLRRLYIAVFTLAIVSAAIVIGVQSRRVG